MKIEPLCNVLYIRRSQLIFVVLNLYILEQETYVSLSFPINTILDIGAVSLLLQTHR